MSATVADSALSESRNATPAGGGSRTNGAAFRRVDDRCRRWIAENVMLGTPRPTILEIMVAYGIAPGEAETELELAIRSPYVRGAERLYNRLRKRDWLLATYRKLNRLRPGSVLIERTGRMSREEFLERFYAVNRPVLITGAIDEWPALKRWNLDYLEKRFGDREVEVQFGRGAGADYEAESHKYSRKMKFGEFVAAVRCAGVTNDFYLTANNNSQNKQVMPELWEDVGALPDFLQNHEPLPGFFWFGPAGTITPFHHDLTNNVMAQIVGRKRVKLVPSWDLPMMANTRHVYSAIDGRKVAPAMLPELHAPQVLECVLAPGELLFLPIGWMHWVEGLDVSMTMTFTNFVFDNDFHTFYSTYHGV